MIHLIYFIGCKDFYPSTNDRPRTDGVRNYGAVVRSLSDWLLGQLARTDVTRTIGYVTTGQKGFEHSVKDLLEIHNHRYDGPSENPWNVRGGYCKWEYRSEANPDPRPHYETVYGSNPIDGQVHGGEHATWQKFLSDYGHAVDNKIECKASIVYAIQQSQVAKKVEGDSVYTNPATLDFFNENVAQHVDSEAFSGVNLLEGLESNGSSVF
jgi:hypothetical protein